jgi:hypothetical protein
MFENQTFLTATRFYCYQYFNIIYNYALPLVSNLLYRPIHTVSMKTNYDVMFYNRIIINAHFRNQTRHVMILKLKGYSK